MREEFFPTFDSGSVFVDPWLSGFESTFQVVLMGFFVCLACGVIGNFVVARRLALVGDAISHSLLPGIAIAFVFTSSHSLPAMLIGAAVAGVLTTVLIELIHRKSRVKPDAAIGIVFTTLFAVGVVVISIWLDNVHLDADCVLYGEIGLVPLRESFILSGANLGPLPIAIMGAVALLDILLVIVFYRVLLVTSFDAGLARSLGMPVNTTHYGLMIALALTIVAAFEAVGVVLVVAMLIFPAVTVGFFFERLPALLFGVAPLSLAYSLGGFHLARWLDCSIAGAMVVTAGALFVVAWFFGPKGGLIYRSRALGFLFATSKQKISPQIVG
ncbi:MAG: metal ABC transporter permease [Verrucomicrobia bacterium]|nr:metal ABC transporter permease [Verrucomicrobiota bacterium]MDA0723425.1 metal ABC transporter permease [Verrucomicrobiota bacterium]MDA1046405.1 metal ABC transporter permease [Verrucomicrobiota bacterium]